MYFVSFVILLLLFSILGVIITDNTGMLYVSILCLIALGVLLIIAPFCWKWSKFNAVWKDEIKHGKSIHSTTQKDDEKP